MNKKKKMFRFLMIFLIICLCIGSTAKEFQNDTFYTIKVGESIMERGVDLIDHFSFHNLNYFYPHWLYDILIFNLYNLFGLTGIYISNIILYIFLVLSIYYVSNKTIKNEFVSALISLIVLLLVGSFITARAQLISAILFLYEVYFIETFMSTDKKRYGLGLIMISWLIANMHTATWPMVFVLYFPYVVENILLLISKSGLAKILKGKIKFGLNSYNKKITYKENNKVKKLLIVMFISLLMGFLTPLKDIPFTYTIRTMLGNSQLYISEHQQLVLFSIPSLALIMFIIIGLLMFTKIKIELHDLFMLLGLTFMAFLSFRHTFLLVVVGSVAVSRIVNDFFLVENDNSIQQIMNFITIKPVAVILMIIIILYSFNIYKKNDSAYINLEYYPVKASSYILDNLDLSSIRLYNEYNYGSYLIYKNIPVFIDSRADLYLPQFNKDVTIFDDYINICNSYEKVFQKYGITHVLINNDDNLKIILGVDDNYNVIYHDKYFTLYERLI